MGDANSSATLTRCPRVHAYATTRIGCCGAECPATWYPTPGEPCWGAVEVVGEDYDEEAGDASWVHACQGHADVYGSGGAYVPDPDACPPAPARRCPGCRSRSSDACPACRTQPPL